MDHELRVDIVVDQLHEIARRHRMEGMYSIGQSLTETLQRSGLDGKAPDMGNLGGYGPMVNCIPSSEKSVCTPELFVFCYDKDHLDERLREMIYHMGIDCREITRAAMVVVTKWEPWTYRNHRQQVERLRSDGKEIVFVLISEAGVAELVV